jgi:signal transduction histidine kinase
MTINTSRALVAMAALTGVLLISTVEGTRALPLWIGMATIATAVALATSRAPRQASFVALSGLALVMGFASPVDDGLAAFRWLALAALPMVIPLAALAFLHRTIAIRLVVVGCALSGPIRALLYDPFLDPACRGCTPLPTALALPPSAAGALAMVGGLLVVLGLCADLLGETQTRFPVIVLLPVAAWALAGWSQVRGTLPQAEVAGALVATCAALWLLARTYTARTHLRRLTEAVESGAAPQESLRRTLQDSSLTLDFAAGPGRWLDAEGWESAGPATGQMTTDVRLVGESVARIHHKPDSGRADRLVESLSPEIRLAVEAAGLTAQLEAQVRLLQESRSRVVEAGDESRRRLERALHDGAQQELLALGFDLRRAGSARPDDSCLALCMAEVSAALQELRTLATGVYPALLTAAGLGPAVAHAATSSETDIVTLTMPDQRFDPAVERTAYLLVVDMARRGSVEVHGRVAGGRLHLQVTGPTLPGDSVVPERVAALGGTFQQAPNRTEVSLPCG